MAFQPAPTPKSLLARHRLLSPSAGIKVSPLCLGGMNFGDAWKSFMGECDKKATFELLDFFHEQGGNFIDTANNYQNGESEMWIGEWMKARGNRDEMVIATKYTTAYRVENISKGELQSNFIGNSTKSLHVSVAASLRKLQTDYIDLLYVHWWDFTTSIPELMQSLNHLVVAGKVLYLGISDTPAWIVSKANEYARNHGLRTFSVYQGRWNAAMRDLERDIVPMCQAEGMGIAPWGALGGGKFKTQAAFEAGHGERKVAEVTENDKLVSKALENVATRHSTGIHGVAMAYVMAKVPYVFPIVGGRKVDHLRGNIEALGVALSDEDIKEIEGAAPFDIGFPLNFLANMSTSGFPKEVNHPGDSCFNKTAGTFDWVQNPKPIAPQQK